MTTKDRKKQMDIKQVIELAQACLRQAPTVILGSGASVPVGIPGMGPLGNHLSASALPLTCQRDADQQAWLQFLERIRTRDLESALSEIQVTQPVLSHIVDTTWRFLNSADITVFQRVVADRRCLPLSRLFTHLFRSTATTVNVVTPNYDRIAEYAAEAAGFCAYTGFGYGLLGARVGDPPARVYIGQRQVRTVNVWKVHGSFGWFADAFGSVVSLPPMAEPPPGMTPAIVTPGIEKYRRTHDEPFRSAMHSADEAVRNSTGFLCVGFGFNDPHLQPLLTERCAHADVPLVLITKEISPTTRQIFDGGRCARYLALEESSVGIRVFANEVPDGVEISSGPLWQLNEFLNHTT